MFLSDIGHHQQRLTPRALYLQTIGAVYPGKTGEEVYSAMAAEYWEGNPSPAGSKVIQPSWQGRIEGGREGMWEERDQMDGSMDGKQEWNSTMGLDVTGKAVENQRKTREREEALTEHQVTLEINTPWPAEG